MSKPRRGIVDQPLVRPEAEPLARPRAVRVERGEEEPVVVQLGNAHRDGVLTAVRDGVLRLDGPALPGDQVPDPVLRGGLVPDSRLPQRHAVNAVRPGLAAFRRVASSMIFKARGVPSKRAWGTVRTRPELASGQVGAEGDQSQQPGRSRPPDGQGEDHRGQPERQRAVEQRARVLARAPVASNGPNELPPSPSRLMRDCQ